MKEWIAQLSHFSHLPMTRQRSIYAIILEVSSSTRKLPLWPFVILHKLNKVPWTFTLYTFLRPGRVEECEYIGGVCWWELWLCVREGFALCRLRLLLVLYFLEPFPPAERPLSVRPLFGWRAVGPESSTFLYRPWIMQRSEASKFPVKYQFA